MNWFQTLKSYRCEVYTIVLQAVYDICSKIVSLNVKQNGPIGLTNDDDAELHHQNGIGWELVTMS